jgi:hypothetical protein
VETVNKKHNKYGNYIICWEVISAVEKYKVELGKDFGELGFVILKRTVK